MLFRSITLKPNLIDLSERIEFVLCLKDREIKKIRRVVWLKIVFCYFIMWYN